MEVENVLGSRKKKKENKVTERALYASLFTMVLCCAMLLETTYAWFTQEITTGVAVIQTGEMSAALVVERGVDETGVTTYVEVSADNSASLLQFKAYDTTAQEEAKKMAGDASELTELLKARATQATHASVETTYFEPGGIYYLPPIYVENIGNVDLQYMVTVNFAYSDTVSASDNSDVALMSETEGAVESTKIGDLRDVIGFMVAAGESSTAVDMASLDSTAVATSENTTEGENADGSDSSIENATVQAEAFKIYSGTLSAATGEEKSISDPIIIRATMPSDTKSDYANLKLDGIQIIVTATQLTAPVEELYIESTETENPQ